MKIRILWLSLLAVLTFSVYRAVAADPTIPRITIELRDGSRLVGESLDKKFRFHSALLGELALPVQDIRSLDCSSTNSVTLFTTTGDTLAVSFLDADLDVKTAFGKVKIPVDSIRKLNFAGAAYETRIPGLVALWSGESKGEDSIGSADTRWTDVSYADGLVGQALSLNGYSSCAEVPSTSALDVGAGDGMTLSGWIKPNNVSSFHPIIEWEKTAAVIGVQLWIGQYPSSEGVLCANFVDSSGNSYIQVPSPPGTLVIGQWQHVAVTYDRKSALISLYVNGTLVNQRAWSHFTPLTTGPIWISRRPNDHPGDWTYNAFFNGLLDQLAIYDRALSADEIKSICIQDNHGEMPPAPTPQTEIPEPMNGIYRDGSKSDWPGPASSPPGKIPDGG